MKSDPKDCLYCQNNETLHNLMIEIAPLSVSRVFLFKEQTYRGRCLVAYNGHVNDLFELSDEERADFVRLISINSEHLVRLIDDILDLSKIESNTIKFTYSCCSLKSMMKDIEKEQAVKQLPEIEIKALLPDDDIYINTDATRLKQVICNFINNARKFTEKGYIHFGFTSHSEKDQLVYLFVEDTGEGIPQECQKEIFDRFYKVNTFKQGTGLGLSICKTIVEHLQGSISVESEIGKGSRFIVTLPFKRQSKGV